MTLSFSTHIDGKPTHFVGKIWDSLYTLGFGDIHYSYYQMQWLAKGGNGDIDQDLPSKRRPKIHSIRRDKANRWRAGNRIHFVINNRTDDRFQFAPVVTCKSVQYIQIKPAFRQVTILPEWHQPKHLSDKAIEELAINDGFESVEQFWNFFYEDFSGKIIHWTDYRY
jgi:hypothetical protein